MISLSTNWGPIVGIVSLFKNVLKFKFFMRDLPSFGKSSLPIGQFFKIQPISDYINKCGKELGW